MYIVTTIYQDANLFKKSTDLEVEQFDILFTYLNPGTNSSNLKYYESSKKIAEYKQPDEGEEQSMNIEESVKKKSGPKPKTHPKDQLFMSELDEKWIFSITYILALQNSKINYFSIHNYLG